MRLQFLAKKKRPRREEVFKNNKTLLALCPISSVETSVFCGGTVHALCSSLMLLQYVHTTKDTKSAFVRKNREHFTTYIHVHIYIVPK